MNSNNKKNSQRPRSAAKKRRDMSRFITKRSVKGGRMQVPTNPPDIVSQPWNQITLVYEMTAETQQVEHIRNRLLEQLDLDGSSFYHHHFWNDEDAGTAWKNVQGRKPGSFTYNINAPRINIRIQSIRLWNLTGKAVSLTVYDYTNTSVGDEQLIGLVDAGGPNAFPALGYQMPLAIQEYVIRTSDNKSAKTSVFTVSAAAGDRICVYIKADWKPDSKQKDFAIKFAYDESSTAKIMQSNKILRNLQLSSAHIESKLDRINDSQPSTFRKIVDGVVTTASIVLPIVAQGRQSDTVICEDDFSSRLLRLEQILKISPSEHSFEQVEDDLLDEHTDED